MKTKPKKQKNPKPQVQGVLLMEEMTGKYEEYGFAVTELDKLSKLFSKNGLKLINSKSGDDIYYLVQHLKTARQILEKFNG
jgi:hypothetical protein